MTQEEELFVLLEIASDLGFEPGFIVTIALNPTHWDYGILAHRVMFLLKATKGYRDMHILQKGGF